MENLKVDILYYKIKNDFEMEFNMRGCCNMRLLTDSAETPKTFLGSLSRDVARSKIIICCGELHGEEGLISITAKAIGRSLSEVDCREYRSTDNPTVKIIDGGVPLISSTGFFGGCIVESGPQSIILLCEEKIIRKNILKTLIHPYLQEITLVQMSRQIHPEADIKDPEIAPFADPEEGDLEPVSENSDEALPEQTEETEPTLEQASEQQPEPQDAEDSEIQSEPFETEPENSEDKSESADENQDGDENDGSFFTSFIFDDDDEDEDEPEISEDQTGAYFEPEEKEEPEEDEDEHDGHKPLALTILIITVLLLVILGALAYILFWLPHTKGLTTTEFVNRLWGDLNL